MSNENKVELVARESSDKDKKQDKIDMSYERYAFNDVIKYKHLLEKGLNEKIVRTISELKNEPEWMLETRLKAYKIFREKKMPNWGADLSEIDFENIHYYASPTDDKVNTWDMVPDDIKKTFDKIGIPEAERKFLGGASAQYDCITGDTKVPTNPKGLKPISEIEVGEHVFALNEKTKKIERKKVLAVMDKGTRPIFKVKVAGRIIKATFNHPFLALVYERKEGRKRRGEYRSEWKYLRDLKAGDLIGIAKNLPIVGSSYNLTKPILRNKVKITNQFEKEFELDINYLYKKVSLPEKTMPDLMWLFGLFIGDGWADKSGRVSFAIPDSEPKVRDELKKVVRNLFNCEIAIENKYKMTIRSRIITEFFKVNGFDGTAKTKKLPKWIYAISKNEILAFIGGYLDSDGTVRLDKKAKDAVITSVNKKLLEEVRALTFYCGLQCSSVTTITQKYSYDKTKKQTFHRLHISGDLSKIDSRNPFCYERFNNKKYFHTFTSAKNTKPFKKYTSEDLGFAKIQSIEYAGEENVFDITVEDHHNFIADGIVVHNSEVLYHNLKKEWQDQGVVFTDMDSGLKEYPEIVKQYFGSIIPMTDNKFAALNTAVWSGGSFVYIPKGVEVKIPLQAYFRINTKNAGQFERTLIIAEEGAKVHYVEGCSAPVYSASALHSAVVEILAKKSSYVRYTTIQNWSSNVYNLVTKRAVAHEKSVVEWLDGNIGSKVTMKYPSIILKGEGARGEVISVAFAGKGQNQDAGAKIIHQAPNTTSQIISKSISQQGGRSSYRGLVKVLKGAKHCKCFVQCDAYLLDKESRSDTYPTIQIDEDTTTIGHEAKVGKIGSEKLFYLMSRGYSEKEALALVVLGFIESFTKQLPMEYAVELNRLIEVQLEGAVG